MWLKRIRKGDTVRVAREGYDKGIRAIVVEANSKTVLVNTGDCLKAFQANELIKVRRGKG